MMLRARNIAAVLVVSILIVLVLFQFAPRTQPKTQVTVTVGYLPLAASLPLFVAIDQGFFTRQNLILELSQFNSSNELAIAGATARVDVMVTCALSTAFDTISVAPRPFRAFMTNGYTKPTASSKPTDYLIARPGITIDALRGKRIAFFPGSVSRVFAELTLPKFGISKLSDIEFVEMPPAQWLPALAAGTIDAVAAVEPNATMIMRAGVGVPLVEGLFADVQTDVPISAAWFAKALETDIENRVVVAMRDAVDFIRSNREVAVQSFAHYTEIPSDIFTEIGLNEWGFTPEPIVRERAVSFARLLESRGAVKAIPSTEEWLWHQPP